MTKAPLTDRLHGRECAHRAKGNTFDADLLREARQAITNPPRHDFWGAGEPDCPREIKASNGELWKMRCKVCGLDNPRDDRCFPDLQGQAS